MTMTSTLGQPSDNEYSSHPTKARVYRDLDPDPETDTYWWNLDGFDVTTRRVTEEQLSYSSWRAAITAAADFLDGYDVEECPETCDECGLCGFVHPNHFHEHGLHWEGHVKHPAHFTGEAVCSCGAHYCEDKPGFVPYTGQP